MEAKSPKESNLDKAYAICRAARKAECSVDTLDGTLCPVCADCKADDEPESIVGILKGASDCYNGFGTRTTRSGAMCRGNVRS